MSGGCQISTPLCASLSRKLPLLPFPALPDVSAVLSLVAVWSAGLSSDLRLRAVTVTVPTQHVLPEHRFTPAETLLGPPLIQTE